MDIGKWVRAARKHAGWTQTQLGDKLAVTKGNVSSWELGNHEPSLNQMLKIAEYTGYPLFGVESGGSWPFTPQLLAAGRAADPASLRRAENAARAALDMESMPSKANPAAA